MASDRPVIEVAIEPGSKADAEKLGAALQELVTEDLSFHVSTDQQSGQIILKGVSELHLDNKVDTLRHAYKVNATVGAPQVSYRETIRREGTIDYIHKKQSGGSGQFARVKIHLIPDKLDSGFMFQLRIRGDAVPKEYIPGVERGVESVLRSGVLAGFPVVDLRVELVDGGYHDVDSSELAFEIAARAALREGLRKCHSVLLEPIMKVEVATPENFKGTVIADLRSRRGRILDQNMRGTANVIRVLVPLADMFGYVNSLRAMSQGHGTFTMRFDHYEMVPTPDDDPFGPAIGMRA
jgi:elongation factor G